MPYHRQEGKANISLCAMKAHSNLHWYNNSYILYIFYTNPFSVVCGFYATWKRKGVPNLMIYIQIQASLWNSSAVSLKYMN